MQIVSVQVDAIAIPLNFQFRQANNSGTSRSLSAVIQIRTADGIAGYGESCPRTYVTGESMDDVLREVRQLTPELLERPIETLDDLRDRLSDWAARGIGASTRCALELAWLDAWSRSCGESLASLLDVNFRGTLSYSLILPLIPPQVLAGLLQKLPGLRPPAIKLKADPDQAGNRARIARLREHFGPEIPIRLDVNGGWTLGQARTLIPELLEMGIRSFEQPVEPQDLTGMQQLTREFGRDARIMADESLLDLQSAAYMLEHQMCNHFNLKISKLGGIFTSLQIYRLAKEHGVPCQLGAHFGETSLLTSAGALLAALVDGELSACEGAMGEFLLAEDITTPSIRHAADGSLDLTSLWQEPGLAGLVVLPLEWQNH